MLTNERDAWKCRCEEAEAEHVKAERRAVSLRDQLHEAPDAASGAALAQQLKAKLALALRKKEEYKALARRQMSAVNELVQQVRGAETKKRSQKAARWSGHV